jgi:monofunctional biosynthetic peptidoglycan transglycosylase
MLKLLFKLGLVVLVPVLALQLWFFLNVLWWNHFNPSTTAFMEEGLTRLQARHPGAELRFRWAAYRHISLNLKRAVVAAEDSRFLSHDGFDVEGMEYALRKDLRRGRIVAGGSTISQQLAKNLFLSASRNPLRKLQEAAITVMIENVWTKRRILEVYLNVIEWGNGIYGATAASHHYFRTSAASLDPSQAALLAAMIPDPRYYETHRSSRRLLRRQAIIEQRMWRVSVPR